MMVEFFMLLFMFIILFMDLGFLMLIKNFISCLLMLMSVKLFMKYYFMVNFSMISMGLSMSIYSFMMVILVLWIFSLIILFLNEKKNYYV